MSNWLILFFPVRIVKIRLKNEGSYHGKDRGSAEIARNTKSKHKNWHFCPTLPPPLFLHQFTRSIFKFADKKFLKIYQNFHTKSVYWHSLRKHLFLIIIEHTLILNFVLKCVFVLGNWRLGKRAYLFFSKLFWHIGVLVFHPHIFALADLLSR